MDGDGGEVSRKRKRGRGGKNKKKKSNDDSFEQKAASSNTLLANKRSKPVVEGGGVDVKKKALGGSKTSSLLDKMRAKLSGGHFRMLNEKLYTCTGKVALNYFSKDPLLFNVATRSKCYTGLSSQ